MPLKDLRMPAWLQQMRRPRCAICRSRVAVGVAPVVEEADHRSWLLCATCAQAVQEQRARVRLRTPHRLRVALGVVASERARHGLHTWLEHLGSRAVERLLITIVLIAFAVHAVAFLLVVVVVAGPHRTCPAGATCLPCPSATSLPGTAASGRATPIHGITCQRAGQGPVVRVVGR